MSVGNNDTLGNQSPFMEIENTKPLNVFFFLVFLIVSFLLSTCGVIFEEKISKDSISILAPSYGATLTSNNVTFWWEYLDNADEYRVQIVQPNFENTITLVLDTLVSENQLNYTLNTGIYEWRVRGENSAYNSKYATRSFTIDSVLDISGSMVNVIYPTTNLVTNESAINFIWESLSGATSYHLEIAQPSFVVPFTIVVDQTLTTSSYTFNSSESSYSWRITASNANSLSTATTGSFEVDVTSPDQPVLLSPVNNATITDDDITFSWEAVSGTSSYSIYLMQDVTLLDTVLNTTTINTESILTGFDTVNYYWNVRAFDEAGNKSLASETRKFKKD